MFRKARVLLLGTAWTTLCYFLAGLTGTLTLGLLAPRLANLWGGIWGRGILAIGGVRLEIEGREHIAERRARVLVLNHASFLDMAILGALGPPAFLALVKREFARNPLIGWGMWASGMHFVDRRDPRRARASLDRLERRLRRGARTVVIFPEGTRSHDGRLRRFKTGAVRLAARTGVPLVPAVIHGAWDLAPPGVLVPRPGRVRVVIHPPRDSREWREEDARAITDALREDYRRWLGETAENPD